MEQLGYKFKNDKTQLKKEIEEANICFMHAPLFHPALKTVGPIRKNFGLRTFFNMLGPMVNPASPKYQLVGVYSLEMARIYNYLLQQTGKSFTIIHSLDGYDEISLTNDTKVITNEGEKIKTPLELGKRIVEAEDIHGGKLEDAAKIFLKIIKRRRKLGAKCSSAWQMRQWLCNAQAIIKIMMMLMLRLLKVWNRAMLITVYKN